MRSMEELSMSSAGAEHAPHRSRGGAATRTRLTTLLLGVLAGGVAACDTGTLLEVELPGRVSESALNDPRLAGVLVQSVIADVECAWDNYVTAAAHHSDQWIASSGNSTMARWGLRDIPATFTAMSTAGCGSNYGLHTPLHGARVQANSNYDRIVSFPDAEVPRKTEFLATIRAFGAWPLIAFSEGFCGTPLDGADQVLGPQALAALAEEQFTEAITLASQAGRADLRNLALAGRARARLTLENYTGVIADASEIPEGFLFQVTRDNSSGDRQNRQYTAINGVAADPPGQKHATIAPNFRDFRWKGVPDPRMDIQWDGTLGFDFFTRHFRHTKANSFSDPVTLARWAEVRLFMAEAYAMTDRLDEARAILDDLHQRAGIPGVTAADGPTRDDVIRLIQEERVRELFSEGGHRLRDHLRWRGTPLEIPFLGEPGSIHPGGQLLDPDTGAPLREYEGGTCFPVPTVEIG